MKSPLLKLNAAWNALRILRDPKDIRALLKLGDLLSETEAFRFAADRLLRDPAVSRLAEERYSPGFPSIETLRGMPEGSLGQAFAAHMELNGLSPYPRSSRDSPDGRVYLRERQREIHDILHAVLGYGIDVADEAALNAFLMAQCPIPISTLIVAGSVIQTVFKNPNRLPSHLERIAEGWKIGKSARTPFAIRWEECWARPVTEMRHELLGPAPA